MEEKRMTLKEALNNKDFANEFDAIIINDDIPITLTDEDRAIREGQPIYTDSVKEGRSGVAVARISQNTLAVYTSKSIKRPDPINWNEVIQQAGFFERCHIIGYRLDARITGKDNLFIGTERLNTSSMEKVENDVAGKVRDGKTCIYKVTPMYKFKEDIVPIGVLIEAEAINDIENFHICKFCYNIQNDYKINYYDGSQEPIENVYVKKEKTEGNTSDDEDKNNSIKGSNNYKINIKSKVIHKYLCPCNSLNNVDPKYIQETTGNIDVILSTLKEYRKCKKCYKD